MELGGCLQEMLGLLYSLDLCHNNRWGEGGVMKVIKPPGVIMMSITVYQLSALINIITQQTTTARNTSSQISAIFSLTKKDQKKNLNFLLKVFLSLYKCEAVFL